jgi:hypothetical protein
MCIHRANVSDLMPSLVRKEGSYSPQSGVGGVASAYHQLHSSTPPQNRSLIPSIVFIRSTCIYNTISSFRKMSGFPSLQPAFTVRVDIDAPMQVGGQHGPQLVIVPMVSVPSLYKLHVRHVLTWYIYI